MPLPKVFDQNEWFVLLWLIIGYTVIFFLPKRTPLSILLLIMLFSSTVARVSDHLLAAPRLDLYNIMDTGVYDFFDFLTYFLYAPFGFLFVFIYERMRLRGIETFFYIVIWSLFGTFFEGICVHFNVFTYNNWQLEYSFHVYLVTQSLTLGLFILLTRTHKLLKSGESII